MDGNSLNESSEVLNINPDAPTPIRNVTGNAEGVLIPNRPRFRRGRNRARRAQAPLRMMILLL